jgi:hypothetical protein
MIDVARSMLPTLRDKEWRWPAYEEEASSTILSSQAGRRHLCSNDNDRAQNRCAKVNRLLSECRCLAVTKEFSRQAARLAHEDVLEMRYLPIEFQLRAAHDPTLVGKIGSRAG